MKVLFVCSSDRTRGPLAAALFAHLAKEAGVDEWECDSAGLHAQRGQMIAPEVRTVLAERGLEPRRIGVQFLTPKLVKSSDLILCMTSNLERDIAKQFPPARNKLKLLMSLADDPIELFDPNHLGVEKFRDCLALMEPALRNLVARIQ